MNIDLHPVLIGLIDAQHAAEALNDRKVPVEPEATNRARTEIAEVTRSLLALADRLDLLSGLVRQEYWVIKGQQSLDAPSHAERLMLKPYL